MSLSWWGSPVVVVFGVVVVSRVRSMRVLVVAASDRLDVVVVVEDPTRTAGGLPVYLSYKYTLYVLDNDYHGLSEPQKLKEGGVIHLVNIQKNLRAYYLLLC
jgi:hypothetical protein